MHSENKIKITTTDSPALHQLILILTDALYKSRQRKWSIHKGLQDKYAKANKREPVRKLNTISNILQLQTLQSSYKRYKGDLHKFQPL